MISHTFYCDKCKAKIEELKEDSHRRVETLSLIEDRVTDAAGSMENEVVTADLCSCCIKTFLLYTFKKLNVRFPGQILRDFLNGVRP